MERKFVKIYRRMTFVWCDNRRWIVVFPSANWSKSSSAAWVAKDDPPPTIVRRNKFAPKTLFCMFFKSTDPLLIHRVERWKQSITNITSKVVCSLLSRKSRNKDLAQALMQSNFIMITEDHMFTKMYSINFVQKELPLYGNHPILQSCVRVIFGCSTWSNKI